MKKTQIDRAIEALQSEMAVLQLAIDTLRAQQALKPPRQRQATTLTEPVIGYPGGSTAKGRT